MSDYKVKVIATMNIDEQREQDLVKFIIEMRERHKFGEFVTAAIRACWEHPEYLTENGYTDSYYGFTTGRTEFIKQVTESIAVLNERVSKLLEMATEMKYTTMMGRKLGIEQRVDNQMLAAFIIQQQVEKLARELGVKTLTNDWNQQKLEKETEVLDEMLEKIIIQYSGLTEQLKLINQQTPIMVTAPVRSEQTTEQFKTAIHEPVKTIEKETTEIPETTEIQETTEQKEVVDMSEAAWDLLDAFVG